MKQFGCFQLDTRNECLWQNGTRIGLTPKPFAVLRYLVENPQRLVTHDELLDKLWPETYVQPQVLRTYVLELRKLLGDQRREPAIYPHCSGARLLVPGAGGRWQRVRGGHSSGRSLGAS